MKYYIYGSIYVILIWLKRSGLILTDICNGLITPDIWKHIWSEYGNVYRSILRIYWPIYDIRKLSDICKVHTVYGKNLSFENFHISIKKWKISTYIGQNIIFGKNTYIGQYSINIYRSIYDIWYWYALMINREKNYACVIIQFGKNEELKSWEIDAVSRNPNP